MAVGGDAVGGGLGAAKPGVGAGGGLVLGIDRVDGQGLAVVEGQVAVDVGGQLANQVGAGQHIVAAAQQLHRVNLDGPGAGRAGVGIEGQAAGGVAGTALHGQRRVDLYRTTRAIHLEDGVIAQGRGGTDGQGAGGGAHHRRSKGRCGAGRMTEYHVGEARLENRRGRAIEPGATQVELVHATRCAEGDVAGGGFGVDAQLARGGYVEVQVGRIDQLHAVGSQHDVAAGNHPAAHG